jgi:mannose-1-phosphate guanylyltransferase/mannose-6-phosphate isomerase
MIIPVILCGGSGTRLWPLSRAHMPKQLQPVHGSQTMLQATAGRVFGLKGMAVLPPLVVCNESHRFVTRHQLTELSLIDSRLIAEPTGRNTAPALTLAALLAQRDDEKDEDPVLVVMPADHVIADIGQFQSALVAAIDVAQKHTSKGDAIVTFGVVPTEPATGYGYLRMGGASGFGASARELAQFVEKPPLDVAQSYVASGQYLWNSGLFVLRVSVWLKAMASLAPAMLASCTAALASARSVGNDYLLDRDIFAACPSDSVDYAVMEKLAVCPSLGIHGVVIPLDAGWSDVGAWDSAWTIADKDSDGNAAIGAAGAVGGAMFEASHNNYVRSTGPNAPVIALVGVNDMVVVQTPDAILVAHKDRAQDVKQIAGALASRSDPRADLHRKVVRPWGWYDSLGAGPAGTGFQVKQIGVYPGQSLSLQRHNHRAEHWVVVRGTATITVGETVRDYEPNAHVFIPLGAVHRLQNNTATDVEIVEVQLGAYLGEDDIVRLQDNYQRT